ncbi:MAG: hypothetical protein HYY76_07220 [Acidobacteria bacterium]|nr:hypothetical protein [Acidobacteriota bacterium]
MFDELNERRPSYDPIVAEVRAARTALFAAAGNDIHEFCRRARENQRASGHPVVSEAVRPDESVTTQRGPHHTG